MTDIAGLVLGVPGYVEDFVKLGRLVMKLKSLEKDHIDTVTDAIFCAETLRYYAECLDVEDKSILQHPSRPLLEEALIHSYKALDAAQAALKTWTERFGTDDQPRKKAGFAVIASRLAARITCFPSDDRDLDETPPARNTFSSNLLTKASYLAFGVVEIKDAMERLNKWMTRFGQLLLTSPNLRVQKFSLSKGRLENMTEDVAFVARARDRLTKADEVPMIDIERLGPSFDIDPKHKSGVHRLKDGDFAGYIIDFRDLFIENSGIAFDAEVADTLRICRLAAEQPSDGEIGARASAGILACAGYALRTSPAAHILIFRLPPGTGTPCTLRSLLLSDATRYSLNSRLQFCVKLATSVFIFHSLGLVHKNIRPDSVLIANDLRTDSNELGTPFLVSFGQARLSAGTSTCNPYKGQIYAETLYVHPRHMHGMRPKWQMRDDIFSLGICLFEIAVWRSLLIWDSEEGGLVGDFDFLPLSDEHYDEILSPRGEPMHEDRIWMRRNDLIKYAREMIPFTMGETFRDIAVECLRYGDNNGLASNGKSTNDDDLNQQSVMFLEETLTKLRKLVFTL